MYRLLRVGNLLGGSELCRLTRSRGDVRGSVICRGAEVSKEFSHLSPDCNHDAESRKRGERARKEQ